MEEKEEWLPVKGYKGLYEVSNMGNVRSLPRGGTSGRNLIPRKTDRGYMAVCLSNCGIVKVAKIHRLVAEAFIHNPDPDLFIEVNHKDEDKTNNHVSNLEWCTHAYNSQYSKNIAVEQLDMDGNVIKRWESTREAERHGYHSSTISYCCQGKRKQHKGYRWRYAE